MGPERKTPLSKLRTLLTGAAAALVGLSSASAQMGSADKAEGWLRWRGPLQTGVSFDVDLPDTIDAEDADWTFDMRGRGAPVIANGRVYAMAYEGEKADLEEALVCLDEKTGEKIWEFRFSDYLSDVIYNRYAITSPSIDPETGNIYIMSTGGDLCAFNTEGERLWMVPMVEMFGRLTYPNGRTLGPLVEGDFVYLHTMSSHWGPLGPARDRFYAFDKLTGENIWTSTPGGPPKDSPYSYPAFEWRSGNKLMYAGTAGGNMVAVNALTGKPAWRYQMTIGGVCASPVIDGNQLLAVHGKENLDSSNAGRMIAIDLNRAGPAADGAQAVLDKSYENWRNDEPTAFTSSPVLADGMIFNTVFTGELLALDAETGETLWTMKLATSQIHASPLYADGKLYVPMNDGTLHIIRPTREGGEVLSKTQLEGNCLGAPSICNGRIYIHTTEKLYCFAGGSGKTEGRVPTQLFPRPGKATALRIIPAEVLVQPGETVNFRVQSIDAAGQVVQENVDAITWDRGRVRVTSTPNGKTVTAGATPGAATLTAKAGDLSGTVRFRIVYPDGFTEDFESIELSMGGETKFARPPGFWISGWPKWDVREKDGSKVLSKTLSNPILQRTMGFFGDPDSSAYTLSADIMSEGNRRMMSAAGLVNQRYLITLKGNHRVLEITSNVERIKHSIPFRMRPGTWYTLKTRVDTDEAGASTVRAKAWPRDEAEPEAWMIEFTHTNGHSHGAPGIYGFSPQSRFGVYVDNIEMTENN